MQYLVSRYGEGILTRMVQTNAVGAASIDQALWEIGFSERFNEIFTNWTIANYVNDCQLGEGQKFCYLNSLLPYFRFHVLPSASNFLTVKDGESFSFSENTKDWSAHWYEILPVGSGYNLAVNFSSQKQSNFRVPILIFYADGTKSLKYLTLTDNKGAEIEQNFGSNIKSVVLISSSQEKISGVSLNDPPYNFSYNVQITSLNQIPVSQSVSSESSLNASVLGESTARPNYPDGSLIRAKGDFRVFVIKGKYKRWIQSPQIFAAYPHFGWQNIIEVSPAERDWYQDAWFVRSDGDTKVYEINGDQTKHWLNMSARQFSDSGRSWNSVFIINSKERDLYKIGAEVLR